MRRPMNHYLNLKARRKAQAKWPDSTQRLKKCCNPCSRSIARMSLSDRRAWRVSLENGTLLELGREQMGVRLERYVQVHDRSIVQLNQQLTYVDLRYPSGFAVR